MTGWGFLFGLVAVATILSVGFGILRGLQVIGLMLGGLLELLTRAIDLAERGRRR